MKSLIVSLAALLAPCALIAPARAHAAPPCRATASPVRALVAYWDPDMSSIIVTFYGHPVSSFGLPPSGGQAVEITATRMQTATLIGGVMHAVHTARVVVLGTMHGPIDMAADGADTRGVFLALPLAPPVPGGDRVTVTVVLWRDCRTYADTLSIVRQS